MTKLSGTQYTMRYEIQTYRSDPARSLISVYFSQPPKAYESQNAFFLVDLPF